MKNRDKYILKKNEYDLLMSIESVTHQCPIATIGGIEFEKRFARCYEFRNTGCDECVQAWLNEEGEKMNHEIGNIINHEILVPAVLYKEEITREFQKKFYTEDMLFETGSLDNWTPDISDNPDASTYQFAILDDDEKLAGFICYHIDWYTSCASQFGLISFDKGNSIIGLAVYKTIRTLIYKYKLHRIEFRMVGGNPVERHYDKMCSSFGGTKHILKDAIKDRQGHYHDDVIYEIIRNGEEKCT